MQKRLSVTLPPPCPGPHFLCFPFVINIFEEYSMKWATGNHYTNNFILLTNFSVVRALLFLSNILYFAVHSCLSLPSHGSSTDVIFIVPCAGIKNPRTMKIIKLTFFSLKLSTMYRYYLNFVNKLSHIRQNYTSKLCLLLGSQNLFYV